MAQVTIPDEQYQALAALAQGRGISPDQPLAALVERLVHEDQVAFWGEGVVEELRRQMAETDGPPRHLSEDEFFAELEAIPPAPRGTSTDADI